MKIFIESEAQKFAFCANITCFSASHSLYICPLIGYLHSKLCFSNLFAFGRKKAFIYRDIVNKWHVFSTSFDARI